MKRLLCIALVLLVLPWGGVFAEGGDEEYVPIERLLWGIPFGVSAEECIALAKDLAGIELDVKEFDYKRGVHFSSPRGNLRLLGSWAALEVVFDDEDSATHLSVDIPLDGIGINEECLQFIGSAIEKARQNYGEPLGGGLNTNLYANRTQYSLSIVGGVPDLYMLQGLFQKEAETFAVELYYAGAKLTLLVGWGYTSVGNFLVVVSSRDQESISDELSRLSELQEYSESMDE